MIRLELMQHVPGPDFPTAGIINGAQRHIFGLSKPAADAFICMRARVSVETIRCKRGKEAIIVTELPYQVNKARLIEKIADLVREKKIEGHHRAYATSPTRTACGSSLNCVVGEVSDVVLE